MKILVIFLPITHFFYNQSKRFSFEKYYKHTLWERFQLKLFRINISSLIEFNSQSQDHSLRNVNQKYGRMQYDDKHAREHVRMILFYRVARHQQQTYNDLCPFWFKNFSSDHALSSAPNNGVIGNSLLLGKPPNPNDFENISCKMIIKEVPPS